jgi:hypothetical protein
MDSRRRIQARVAQRHTGGGPAVKNRWMNKASDACSRW